MNSLFQSAYSESMEGGMPPPPRRRTGLNTNLTSPSGSQVFQGSFSAPTTPRKNNSGHDMVAENIENSGVDTTNMSEQQIQDLRNVATKLDKFVNDLQAENKSLNKNEFAQSLSLKEKVLNNYLNFNHLEESGYSTCSGTFKIRVVLLEQRRFDIHYKLSQLVSPHVLYLPQAQKFGDFASAILMGPWLLEWNETSLCVPKKFSSSVYYLMEEFPILGTVDFDAIDKVAEFVADWNSTKAYSTKNCNCQHFVDTFIKNFDVPSLKMKSYAKYLTQMRKQGHGEAKYKVATPQSSKPHMVKFETHEQLDTVIQHLCNNDPIKHEAEIDFLRLMDRMFWFRALATEFMDRSSGRFNIPIELGGIHNHSHGQSNSPNIAANRPDLARFLSQKCPFGNPLTNVKITASF